MKTNNYMEKYLQKPLYEVIEELQIRFCQNTFMGVRAFKNPLDFWVYQQMVYELSPDVIIEVGVNNGGTTLALASMCEVFGKGKVLGIEIDTKRINEKVLKHPRISILEGNACELSDKIYDPSLSYLVIEDSSHTYENTLSVLRSFKKFIKIGGYIIVEDSICHHGLDVGPVPGPYEAICTFLKESPEFSSDREREAYLVTWNPTGFLVRNK